MPREVTLRGMLSRGHLPAAALLLCCSQNAWAQAVREIANPPTLGAPAAALTAALVAQPVPAKPRTDHLLDLFITYTDGTLYNPSTGRDDKVRLRSYQGTGVQPGTPYVSPTIETVPGDTIRVTLHNKLPADPSCSAAHKHDDIPHCFNGTNLHTHGLWVSPSGNGDNVLLSINPGVDFTYEYNIPSDHPSGTFWYHTHRHGSTALQVSSGMAGALIVRGNRLPTTTQHGDVDTLLAGMTERVLVMQQIQYACRYPSPDPDKLGKIKTDAKGAYVCDPGDVGGIESYDEFGPGSWPTSGRYTSLNGEVIPTFETQQGRIERWRMIHAGVRDTISLQFFKVRPGKNALALPLLTAANSAKVIGATCGGDPVPYTLIAADGLTMAAGQTTKLATFQPGYRFDALVVFPDAGAYCVLDSSAPAAGTVNALNVGPQLLGIVHVAPGTKVPDISAYVRDALVASAKRIMPDPVKQGIVDDLENGMKLTSFTPHPDIPADKVTGHQELTFFIRVGDPDKKPKDPTKFEVSNTLKVADAKPYDGNRIDRKLTLGGTDEWTLQSDFVSHPFHIHVNPFQIVSIIDPFGKDVSLPGAQDIVYGPDGKPVIGKDGKPQTDPQYPGLKGVWKDTLWIKSLLPPDGVLPPGTNGIYTITIRTRYERYIGEFVLHCHILDHEDQGMMQNVEVVVPDGPPGTKADMPPMDHPMSQ